MAPTLSMRQKLKGKKANNNVSCHDGSIDDFYYRHGKGKRADFPFSWASPLTHPATRPRPPPPPSSSSSSSWRSIARSRPGLNLASVQNESTEFPTTRFRASGDLGRSPAGQCALDRDHKTCRLSPFDHSPRLTDLAPSPCRLPPQTPRWQKDGRHQQVTKVG